MSELGYSLVELDFTDYLCNHLLNPDHITNSSKFFTDDPEHLKVLNKIVNPSGIQGGRIAELLTMVSTEGFFYALSQDADNLLGNIKQLMELFIKSCIYLKKIGTPPCDFQRLLSSFNCLQGIRNNEQLGYLLFKYLVNPIKDYKAQLVGIILNMTDEEKLLLEKWQFFVFEFKSEFLASPTEQHVLFALKEMGFVGCLAEHNWKQLG